MQDSPSRRLLRKRRRTVSLAANAAFWLSFVLVYQLVQAGAASDMNDAVANGLAIAHLEQKLHSLFELSVQHGAVSSELLNVASTVTYWCSEFAVVGLALVWVYLSRPLAFGRFRNTLIAANVIALVGCYVFPAAPPRELPSLGFVDTVGQSASVNHGQGLLPLPNNQFAAMPSVHSADALIVGVCLALLVRSRAARVLWLLWPPAVWFAVMATANHFWLDVVAGVAVAALGALTVAVLSRPAGSAVVRRASATGGRA